MRTKGMGIYIILMVVIVLIMFWSTNGNIRTDGYTYNQFLADLERENVLGVTIKPNGNGEVPTGEIEVSLAGGGNRSIYVADVKDVIQDLNRYGVDYRQEDVQRESVFLTTVLPILICAVVIFVIFSMMNSQIASGSSGNARMMNFGKSRARMVVDTAKKVTFKNVAGLDEEKEEDRKSVV